MWVSHVRIKGSLYFDYEGVTFLATIVLWVGRHFVRIETYIVRDLQALLL